MLDLYQNEPCCSCANKSKDPNAFGPFCLACRHSYFKDSPEYERKTDYYKPARQVCPRNACAGGYGNCLDVKITNQCNASCAFCIEKGGWCPSQDKTPAELALATVARQDCPTVLILGGEPTMYPGLLEYLKLIRPYKKEIYMTTNGLRLHLCNPTELGKYLDGVNISLHHYNAEINDRILQGDRHNPLKDKTNFDQVRTAILALKSENKNCSVRINCNLTTDGISTRDDVERMTRLAAALNADSIRYTELQDDTEHFVDAYNLFDGLPDEPFYQGCETFLDSPYGIRRIVKVSCGRVCKFRKPVQDEPIRTHFTHVLYPNGTVLPGWATKQTGEHTKSQTGSHPPIESSGCHSSGCHGRW